jgi:DNA-directed RNA polymerase subunit beta
VNKLGFIETPYRKVKEGKVQLKQDVIYLSAEDEEKNTIAQANAPIIEDDGSFSNDRIKARFEGDFPVSEPTRSI